jgi:UDP-3-O-[3-hydroxymyristoyl] glucosamine N-acyltransferase
MLRENQKNSVQIAPNCYMLRAVEYVMYEFSYSLSDLVQLLHPEKQSGNTSAPIGRICALTVAGRGDLSFLGSQKYKKDVAICSASLIMLPLEFVARPKEDQCLLFFKNPSSVLAALCADIEKKCAPKPEIGIHRSALIDPSASISENVSIGAHVVIEANAIVGANSTIMAGCYVGHGVKIGRNCTLHAAVKVMNSCEIGNDVTLAAGAVIGSDGFGYETVGGRHLKIPQIGNVVIGDGVDIGANTTIDRARFASTIIGNGTKIDNLVQIGHNVVVGERCIIAAQTGIAGSTSIGDGVIIGGQVGIAGHISIPSGTMVAGKSSVSSCKKAQVLRGSPAMEIHEAERFFAVRKKISGLLPRVAALEDAIGISKTNTSGSGD